jgi:hypothetical protein
LRVFKVHRCLLAATAKYEIQRRYNESGIRLTTLGRSRTGTLPASLHSVECCQAIIAASNKFARNDFAERFATPVGQIIALAHVSRAIYPP